MRQERLEPLAQTTREHRRIAAAADCHDDRRAIDDCRHDEARQLAIVDDVDRNVPALGLPRDPRIDRAFVRCRDRQPHAVQMLRRELGSDVHDLARRHPLRQSGDKLRRNDTDLRRRSQQQIDLACGDFAAADDEHRLAGKTQENREVVHDQVSRRSCAARLDLQRNHAPARLQAALTRVRVLPPPATGARICTGLDRTRAWRATDARIAAIVQSVVRQVARLDVGPHVLLRPIEQRTDLPQAVPLIPRHRLAERTLLRLLAAHARDPGTMTGDRALERLDLADVAATLPLLDTQVEAIDAVVAHVLLDQLRIRIEDLDPTLVAALDAIEQRERFVVQPAGVEREHPDLGDVAADDVRQDHRLGAEAVRVDDVAVLADGMLEHGACVLDERLQAGRQRVRVHSELDSTQPPYNP